MSYGDGLLIAENADFRTLSYGRNRQELRSDILADIEELWRAYVDELPDHLTEGGLALRQRLQERMHFIPEGQSESPPTNFQAQSFPVFGGDNQASAPAQPNGPKLLTKHSDFHADI